MRLSNKRALLTGGGSGIGAACALKFAAEGCAVAIVDLDEDAAKRVAAGIEAAGGRALALRCDVTRADEIAAAVAAAEDRLGGLDILFNNAAIVHPDDRDVCDTEEEAWDLTMAVNVKSVYLGCRIGIPALLRQGGGAILNTASIVAFMGSSPSQIAYTASKGAVVSMTREIAVCYARRGIRANALCPGPTETDMVRKVMAGGGPPDRNRAHMPMGRLAAPSEIADVAAYLVSDEASFVTGQSVNVDGGLTGAYLCPQE